MLLFLGFSLDIGLGGLALLLALFHRKEASLWVVRFSLLICSLLMGIAVIVTAALHGQVDNWIQTGAYGPPDQIAAHYGEMWHRSADLTAIVGLIGGSLAIALLTPLYRLVKGSWPWMGESRAALIWVGLTWLGCLVSAL